MAIDISRHPCFNPKMRRLAGRVHLPVAPQCNIQCNYCNRKFDCANENRPGVSSVILSPGQAVHYLEKSVEADPSISVTGIAGPGDAFADPPRAMDVLRRVRERFPGMILCAASNGLNLAPWVGELADVDLSHATITMNCVDPEIGAKIYAWVRWNKRVFRGREAAELLFERQTEAIRALKERGILVKINCILIPGVNDHHIEEVAEYTASLGVDYFNCLPLHPVEDTPFETVPAPAMDELLEVRRKASQYVPQMHHCTRCRADASGLLGCDSPGSAELLREAASLPDEPQKNQTLVAAASMEGVLVNQHLGEADAFWVFKQTERGYEPVGRRPAPPAGGGRNRWQQLADTLSDCRAVLTNSAGDSPVSVLAESGIRVVMMEGLIEEGLNSVYGGTPLRAPLRRSHRCGSGCSGNGTGCD